MPIDKTETWSTEKITEEFKRGKRPVVVKFIYENKFVNLSSKKLSEMTGDYKVSVTDFEIVVYDKPKPIREPLKREE